MVNIIPVAVLFVVLPLLGGIFYRSTSSKKSKKDDDVFTVEDKKCEMTDEEERIITEMNYGIKPVDKCSWPREVIDDALGRYDAWKEREEARLLEEAQKERQEREERERGYVLWDAFSDLEKQMFYELYKAGVISNISDFKENKYTNSRERDQDARYLVEKFTRVYEQQKKSGFI